MFLAIFNDTYAEVKAENISRDPVIWPYLKKIFRSKCCKSTREQGKVEHMFQKTALDVVSSVHQKDILETFFEVINEPIADKIRK